MILVIADIHCVNTVTELRDGVVGVSGAGGRSVQPSQWQLSREHHSLSRFHPAVRTYNERTRETQKIHSEKTQQNTGNDGIASVHFGYQWAPGRHIEFE